jgi:hypothetical protein
MPKVFTTNGTWADTDTDPSAGGRIATNSSLAANAQKRNAGKATPMSITGAAGYAPFLEYLQEQQDIGAKVQAPGASPFPSSVQGLDAAAKPTAAGGGPTDVAQPATGVDGMSAPMPYKGAGITRTQKNARMPNSMQGLGY